MLRSIDGSKFKAANNRDNNYTANKVERRREQIETSIERYLTALASADRQESSDFMTAKIQRLQEKVALLKEHLEKLKTIETQLKKAQTSKSP